MQTHSKDIEFFTENKIGFQAFGVKISVEAEDSVCLERLERQLRNVFAIGLERLADKETEYKFSIERNGDEIYRVALNDETIVERVCDELLTDVLMSQIRVTIAEFAVAKVFLHAGVVGWKNRAIVIPARSWSGKSTLVAALVKKGAVYYSDEYAVLDAAGNVHPFPKQISLRPPKPPYTQIDYAVESFGGVAGSEPLPVGLVLLAKYRKDKKLPEKWQPRRLSGGLGIMEILPHALPIRNKPKFVLEVLNKLTSRAIIVKTIRGEAEQFAAALLDYFERNTD